MARAGSIHGEPTLRRRRVGHPKMQNRSKHGSPAFSRPGHNEAATRVGPSEISRVPSWTVVGQRRFSSQLPLPVLQHSVANIIPVEQFKNPLDKTASHRLRIRPQVRQLDCALH